MGSHGPRPYAMETAWAMRSANSSLRKPCGGRLGAEGEIRIVLQQHFLYPGHSLLGGPVPFRYERSVVVIHMGVFTHLGMDHHIGQREAARPRPR